MAARSARTCKDGPSKPRQTAWQRSLGGPPKGLAGPMLASDPPSVPVHPTSPAEGAGVWGPQLSLDASGVN